MCEDMTNVNPPSVVMNCGDDSDLVASDIKNGQSAHLVSTWECLPQLNKCAEIGALYDSVPRGESARTIRVPAAKFVQPFFRNNMHNISQIEINARAFLRGVIISHNPKFIIALNIAFSQLWFSQSKLAG